MTDAAMSRRPRSTMRGYPTDGATALAPQRAPVTKPSGPRLQATPPVPVSAPRAPFVVLVLGVVMAGVLGILVLNTKIYENAFKLSDLQSKQVNLDRQEQQLNQQIAKQEAPNNLAAAAAKQGLVPAGSPAFIRLPDGRVLGIPQPATSSPSVTSQHRGQNPAAAPSTGR